MIEDKDAIRYVLGSLINRPSLATDMTHYSFSPNDFSNSFYRMIYKSIANVINGGGKECSIEEVYSDICSNAVRKESFDKQDGLNYLKDCVAYANPDNFVYYYNRLKKVSLLNDLQNHGYDITDIYDENSFDNSYLEKFEEMSIGDIVTHYRKKFNSIEKKYTVGDSVKQIYAADGIAQLLQELNAAPEVGIPLQGDIFNTVVRGGRQGKFYLRSASSGSGKTRSMVGDACICAYPIRYDSMTEQWANYGSNEKVLFITTEQTPDEIQTMVLAYLSNVNEEKILFSHYSGDEWQRVQQAIKVMEAFSDNLLIIQLPDPNIEQIKSLIRTTIIENDIYIVFYDYIFSSPSLLGEFRDLKIREDVVLNLLSTALKDVAVETNCFLMSATQINAEGKQKKEGVHDEGSLRGSRAIADKVDIGAVLSVVAPEDMPLFESLGVIPNQVLDIYKVRRGRYTRVKIWINSDLGTCRRNDLFITDANLNPLTDFEKADFMHWSSDESITSLINALNNDSLEDDDGNTF